MCDHEPGLFTSSMAAMVMPRKISSDSRRAGLAARSRTISGSAAGSGAGAGAGDASVTVMSPIVTASADRTKSQRSSRLQNHLDASIPLVAEHAVGTRRFAERQFVRDDEARIDRAALDVLHQPRQVAVH